MREKIGRTPLCVAIVLFMSLFALFGCAGGGRRADTVHISTAEDLLLINEKPSANFILDNDLDLGGLTYTPVENFSGKFDGQGHTISNIVLSTSGNTYGFFASTQGAEIKDFALTNFTLRVSTVNNDNGIWAGALVGCAKGGYYGDTYITNCFTQGTIYLEKQSKKMGIGGFVGLSQYANYSNCLSDVRILNVIENETNYSLYLGGLVGECDANSEEFDHCVFTGIIDSAYVPDGLVQPSRILSKVYAGGIVGYVNGRSAPEFTECVSAPVKIEASLSAFTSASNCKIGGIIGYSEGYPKVNSCYYSSFNESVLKSDDIYSCYYSKLTNSYGTNVWQFESQDPSRQPTRADLLERDFLTGEYTFLNEFEEQVKVNLHFDAERWYLSDGWSTFGLKPYDNQVYYHYAKS